MYAPVLEAFQQLRPCPDLPVREPQGTFVPEQDCQCLWAGAAGQGEPCGDAARLRLLPPPRCSQRLDPSTCSWRLARGLWAWVSPCPGWLSRSLQPLSYHTSVPTICKPVPGREASIPGSVFFFPFAIILLTTFMYNIQRANYLIKLYITCLVLIYLKTGSWYFIDCLHPILPPPPLVTTNLISLFFLIKTIFHWLKTKFIFRVNKEILKTQ